MVSGGLSFLARAGYSFGNFGKSVVWSTMEYFFLFFLTELWGVPPQVAGLAILLTLVWDALSDPLAGYLVEQTSTPLGRYAPYLLLGPPACGVSFVFLFLHPGWPQQAMFWYAVAAGLMFRTCYTLCDVPHNALMTRICGDAKEASLVSGMRFFFSSAGSLLVTFAATLLLSRSEGMPESGQILHFTAGAGLIYTLALWIAWASSRRMDRSQQDRFPRLKARQMVRSLRSNRLLHLFLFLALVQAATLAVFSKGLAFYARYVIDDPGWAGAALSLMAIGQALSMPLWVLLASRRPGIPALLTGYGITTFGLGAFSLVPTAGGGLAASLLTGVGIGGVNMVIWAMLPEVVLNGEQRSGQRLEALTTSLFLLAIKLGVGLSAWFTGLALGAAGYEPGSPLPQDFSLSMRIIMCGLPFAGLVICSLALILFPRRKRHSFFRRWSTPKSS